MLITNYFDDYLIVWDILYGKMTQFSNVNFKNLILFVVGVPLILFYRKLNVFGLRTKQNITERHLRFLGINDPHFSPFYGQNNCLINQENY